MTEPLSPLQRRLRTSRYQTTARACVEVLDGIGIPPERRRLLDLSDVEELWPRYLSRLRDGGDDCERWPTDRLEGVQRRLAEIREAMSGEAVVWLALADAEPIGVEVPVDGVLEAGLGYLVSPAGDLVLATRDVADGLCVELNHLPTGDEYEVVTWGRFGA